MKVRFVPAARDELRDAFDWYEQQCPGLGDRFIKTVAWAIDQVAESPAAWSVVEAGIRKRNIGVFPYAVYYLIDNNQIIIASVFHLHADPGTRPDFSARI